MSTVVALIPAYQAAGSIEATVRSARSIPGVTRVLVVDDGSGDSTGELARRAGAEVLRLPVNRGKGEAVAAGVAASPDADVFLLLDSDLGETAAEAAALLDPVLSGAAEMTVAVLPPAGRRGGLGRVRDLAGAGIRRSCGMDARAPLSGQRAVRAELLRGLEGAGGFGLEVALTIDAVRRGARVVEMEAAIEHRHTGRSIAGFRHRARQGVEVLGSLWPRLTTQRQRFAAIAALGALLLVGVIWSGLRWEPSTTPLVRAPERVLVFGFTPFDFEDLRRAETPTLDRLREEGAVGAMTVRTIARRPAIGEGYLSLGAGARLRASGSPSLALPAEEVVDGITALEQLEALTGTVAGGGIAVVGAVASVRANLGVEVASPPGALGDALAAAGITTAAVGSADRPASALREAVRERPAALAAMTGELTVAAGEVDPVRLLMEDPQAPFGVRADPEAFLDSLDVALREARFVVADPGDLQRASARVPEVPPEVTRAARLEAISRTDALLAEVLERLDEDTLVLVVSVAPPGGAFQLTPVFAAGAGVTPGSWITSPSTKRTGLSALTDVAPTVVHSLTGAAPSHFPGNPLHFEPGPVDLDHLFRYDRETNIRERTYYAQAQLFLMAHALVYAGVALAASRTRTRPTAVALARWSMLALASYPVATYLVKAIGPATAGPIALPPVLAVLLASGIATLASLRRGHLLAGLDVVLALTVAVLVADAATGSWLNVSSWLGYSLHSAGRFYGMPNTTFAVLGGATILLAANWVHGWQRSREALAAAAVLFGIVIVANGLPFLGGDVGGMITFVPVFGVTALALWGRPVRLGTLIWAGLVTVAFVGLVAGLDLLRPEASRTHLGRFAAQLLDEGFGPLVETYLRKQSANFRIFRVSIWTWMIPIAAGFVLYLLVWGRGLERLLPPRSALRIGAVAVVSAALLGFASNDSGPIVIALFFVYLLPQLGLLALDAQRDAAAVLHGPVPEEG